MLRHFAFSWISGFRRFRVFAVFAFPLFSPFSRFRVFAVFAVFAFSRFRFFFVAWCVFAFSRFRVARLSAVCVVFAVFAFSRFRVFSVFAFSPILPRRSRHTNRNPTPVENPWGFLFDPSRHMIKVPRSEVLDFLDMSHWSPYRNE